MFHLQDFPEKAYQPKVQLPFLTPPGHCPRKVEIERRKRLYGSQNLESLLAAEHIDIGRLMPKDLSDGDEHVQLNVDPSNPAPFAPFLPLHTFDNTEYDIRTEPEWLTLGYKDDERKPVPAKALLPTRDDLHHLSVKDPSIEYAYVDVGVIDYKEEDRLYLVQKVDKHGRVIVKDSDKDLQYWIPRIQIMFCAEDPRIYTKRVAFAYKFREETEAFLRYQLYVDCMPMEGVGELDQASLKRMMEWAKGCPSLCRDKSLDDYMQILEKEVNIDFCRSMNKIIFDRTVTSNLGTFAFVRVPVEEEPPVPEKACCLDLPEYPYDEQYDKFAFNSLLTREESINALVKVGTECNKVASMSLFHVPMPKYMRLEEFEQTQSQNTSQTALYLKDGWKLALKNAVRTCLRDVGKGWFNIHETNWNVYQVSKMKKLMERVKFNMQDSLRFLVQDSLVAFTQMIVDASKCTFDCDPEMTWGKDLIHSPYK